ncbi:hypothetical protein [Rhizobium ruizarguesonis]
MTDIIKSIVDAGEFLPQAALVASMSVFSVTVLKDWLKARGLFDRYDAVVDKYIVDGPQSASADIEALGELAISPKQRAVILNELKAMKAMIRDLGDISREQTQNLADRFDSNADELAEFKETLRAMDAALSEALDQPEVLDLTKHKQTLHRYWQMSLNPYDRAMKSLAEKTAPKTTRSGPTIYAEE